MTGRLAAAVPATQLATGQAVRNDTLGLNPDGYPIDVTGDHGTGGFSFTDANLDPEKLVELVLAHTGIEMTMDEAGEARTGRRETEGYHPNTHIYSVMRETLENGP